MIRLIRRDLAEPGRSVVTKDVCPGASLALVRRATRAQQMDVDVKWKAVRPVAWRLVSMTLSALPLTSNVKMVVVYINALMMVIAGERLAFMASVNLFVSTMANAMMTSFAKTEYVI